MRNWSHLLKTKTTKALKKEAKIKHYKLNPRTTLICSQLQRLLWEHATFTFYVISDDFTCYHLWNEHANIKKISRAHVDLYLSLANIPPWRIQMFALYSLSYCLEMKTFMNCWGKIIRSSNQDCLEAFVRKSGPGPRVGLWTGRNLE